MTWDEFYEKLSKKKPIKVEKVNVFRDMINGGAIELNFSNKDNGAVYKFILDEEARKFLATVLPAYIK